MRTELTICLTALGILSFSCIRGGQDTIRISVHSDDTCDVDGKTVSLKKLRNHLRSARETNARLELMKIEIALPWDGSQEDCKRQQDYIRQVLTSMSFGAAVNFSQAQNPYVEFIIGLLPWVVVAAVAAVAVTQIKKRKTDKSE